MSSPGDKNRIFPTVDVRKATGKEVFNEAIEGTSDAETVQEDLIVINDLIADPLKNDLGSMFENSQPDNNPDEKVSIGMQEQLVIQTRLVCFIYESTCDTTTMDTWP